MLKERLRAERQAAGYHLRILAPQARRAATVGTVAWGARKALPLLRPLAFGLLSRTIGGLTSKRMLKVVGIAAVGFGAWKLLGSSDEE
ncbi:hypothetical protein H5P28_12740 [Ruficoccus amylovorans]|uniref:Uncharacterized protein n=1 Tax=Ruficoccus amylovorans TaxID=1804625 RepID=A0A842HHV7_9BACT|nr:hypothetical protein [Ruficoccus amylovorans]MBC2595127.1 hypothetical protein [Ruficoccus amylovorans]